MSYADLHTHTLASDGTRSPADNVRLAAEAGLGAVAVTDHDTVGGLAEAAEAGLKYGIAVVPGVEISTVHDGQDIHVLGYWIDDEDPLFLSRLADLRQVRDRRNEMIIARLQELGISITMEDVLRSVQASKKEGDTVGRPHIADALERLGAADSMADAFNRYLGKGAAAYVNPPRITPFEAVRWVLEAGGAPVLAHPGLYGQDELIPQLTEIGLVGLEAYHSDHSPEQEKHYASLAATHGLLITAGSDYHGERGGVVFHAPIGARRVNTDVVDRLFERRGVRP
ncbi:MULTISPECIES: PHP domain-containing protein [unclassified Paenibacillus]|uniref:PHP domain-containing protein n=1 Tax=unclassified Paenibacillus TaxID=185978 RepID=UPI001AE71F61|nr:MULTISPECIES: PHP domain-containing protein [unclassified Paenibacillus]MBP1156107.1 putative metal-dependent phosphoesterase TrpH [Paenibacillus sp. PvP091]MBP1168507.1 putative metal-dependent phosphoesterase TrpH [Paenibacillus sp. PvR098]MBP2439535.1 putative metal-dependent phosphoesterase TrpH [Paenibacillus sp. PvP052]